MPANEPKIRRISANLPEEDFKLLQELADVLNISMTDVIRRGIRDEQFFRRVREEKCEVMVKGRDGSLGLVFEKV
jgi:hypothetical protein